MYRTPVSEGPAQSAWDPEVRVDLTRFQTLRAQLENNFLEQRRRFARRARGTDLELVVARGCRGASPCAAFAVCQDGYIVYSADPSVTPPNLAGVQELAVGFVRVDSVPRGANAIMANDTLELWINDIRLVGRGGRNGLCRRARPVGERRRSR